MHVLTPLRGLNRLFQGEVDDITEADIICKSTSQLHHPNNSFGSATTLGLPPLATVW